MAKTATAPFPHSPVPRRTVRHVPVEERVSVLEAQWETLTPELATKGDVRADVRGAENRLILWILGAGIALAGLAFALFARMDAAITEIKADGRETTARLEAAIAANTARIDRLDAKIDTRFDAIMVELREQRGK